MRAPLIACAAIGLLLTGCAPSGVPEQPAGPAVVGAVTQSPTLAVTPTAKAPVPQVAPPATAPVLDITVTDRMPFNSTLEPPEFDGVWQVVDEDAGYIDDPSTYTTYLLAHARTPWRGHSPGNDWQDLAVNDRVTVDGATYRVTWAEPIPKTDIADAPIWGPTPRRIVLITCVPLLSGETATENRITILEPTS